MSGECWSVGHIADLTIVDNVELLDDVGVAGSSKLITSIVGTAHAGNGGSQSASDALIRAYLLLFIKHIRPDVAPALRQAQVDDLPAYCYRVNSHAVGWNESAPRADDGTAGELLLADAPITLPWGAYWLLLATLPTCAHWFSPAVGVGNNDALTVLRGWENAPEGVLSPLAWKQSSSESFHLATMTAADGLSYMRILPAHVVWLRVNRRDNP